MREVLDQLLLHIETEHQLLGDEEFERRWKPMVDLFRRDIQDLLENESLTAEEAVEAECSLNLTLLKPLFRWEFPGKINAHRK